MTDRTEVSRGNRLLGALLAAALLILVLPASALADPPATTIDSGPGGLTANNDPSFTFSTDLGTSFECRLDGPGAANGTFAPCTSPKDYTDLDDGDYTFQVRAILLLAPDRHARDPQLHRRHHPARHDDQLRPERHRPPTTIRASPSQPRARGELRMPARRPRRHDRHVRPLHSPRSYTDLADGAHTFQVRATDAAANPDPTPAPAASPSTPPRPTRRSTPARPA